MAEEIKPIKVKYKYIPRRVRGVNDPKHVLYDGKLDSAIDSFPPLRNQSGKYVINMSTKEKNFIIKEAGLNIQDLNLSDRNNEYLPKLNIEMPKSGITLNLNDPHDLLKDKILQAYHNVIAPNDKSKYMKASYRYVRLMENEETDALLQVSDLRKEAYKLLGALEESRNRMIMYLLNEGVRMHRQINSKEVRKLVNQRVELSYKKFITTLKDELFEEKGIINMAVIIGTIQEKSKMYFFDGMPLASEGEHANLTNAALFLKDKANSQIRVAITKEATDGFNRTE